MTDASHKGIEQNDPKGKVLQHVKPDMMCGEIHTISMYQPTVIVDSHIHIQSGRCAPLQFVRDQGPGPVAMLQTVTSASRGWIEGSGLTLGAIFTALFEPVWAPVRAVSQLLGNSPHNPDEGILQASPLIDLVAQQKKKTIEVAEGFILEREKVLTNYFMEEALYKDAPHLIFTSVVMTMDMEYCHIDGYFGLRVYNPLYKNREDIEANKPCAYWTPQHGEWVKAPRDNSVYVRRDKQANTSEKHMTPEEFDTYQEEAQIEGITGSYLDDKGNAREVKIVAAPVLMPDAETALYENWMKQLQYTELAVVKYPLKLLPMYHFDPRRWHLEKNATEVLDKVGDRGIYLGFKMYTAQGHRPWDPRLPILKDFYAKCCLRGIPILNHCTPKGAAAYERDEYFDFEHPLDGENDRKQKQDKRSGYFSRHFASPQAWKELLDGGAELVDGRMHVSFKNLYLCLAHFGGPTDLGMEWNRQIIEMIESGEYPNLYTDISSSFADSGFRKNFKAIIRKHPKIKDRILFGTDWYMTFVYSFPFVGKNLWDYCTETKKFLDDFDTSLWPAFTQYNPYRFYRLDQQIGRIAENIIEMRAKDKKILEVLDELEEYQINEIRREVAWIKFANHGHVIFKETP
ncbi:amidohydrolase family protein [Geobacter anodireducens]|uniref:Amidohydrolase family protein n=1 Tax=Geobacter anodireducens TaxID=1340425 RepID=A0ABR9NWY1_9BACT|nr:amidohydrolase family protein [Geobacter anodireducens]MBE2888767.1 amidohydrolase family protein [Geobacter anodireducens]